MEKLILNNIEIKIVAKDEAHCQVGIHVMVNNIDEFDLPMYLDEAEKHLFTCIYVHLNNVLSIKRPVYADYLV